MNKLHALSVAAVTAAAFASTVSAQVPGPNPPPTPPPAPVPAGAAVTPVAAPAAPPRPLPRRPASRSPTRKCSRTPRRSRATSRFTRRTRRSGSRSSPTSSRSPSSSPPTSRDPSASAASTAARWPARGSRPAATTRSWSGRRSATRCSSSRRTPRFFAKDGTPQARFVAESFSDSLIASAPVAAAAASRTQGDRRRGQRAPLRATSWATATRIEYAFRMPFALDAQNTSFSRVTNIEGLTSVQVNAHFAVPKISAAAPHSLARSRRRRRRRPRRTRAASSWASSTTSCRCRRADGRAPGRRAHRPLHVDARRLHRGHSRPSAARTS